MDNGEASSDPSTGEARMTIEGGLAYFPGLAQQRVLSFDRLTAPERQEIATLAEDAHFFDCTPDGRRPGPDARTYTLGLTINGRSRDLCVAEPISDPSLARLVTTVRRLASQG
ncbi:protealysin inhibitor emfourin [Sphingomonas sp. DT-51]|uniref:protealysin inhibitor emfourin n=1 Tax=Sphingomonas sp. DT-51 TaxID=3396165 RepID=UPI003F1D098B